MTQLGDKADQIRRGIRRLEKALDDTQLDSFRKPLNEAMTLAKYRAGWVAQEIQSREEGPELWNS